MTDPQPGPELDALVAFHVMGLVVNGGNCWSPRDSAGVVLDVCLSIAPYSTDLAEAWTVVEKLIGAPDYAVQFTLRNNPDGGWLADFDVIDLAWLIEQELDDLVKQSSAHAAGVTPAEVICRAALQMCTPSLAQGRAI